MHTVKVLDLPFGKFRDKAFPIDNYSNFDSSVEQMICVVSMEQLLAGRLLFVTRQGMSKVVNGREYDVRTRTSAATKLNEEDSVLLTAFLGENMQLVLQSEEGYFLRFNADEIPEKKKAAVGVRAMKLSDTDSLAEAYLFVKGTEQVITYKEKEIALQKLKLAGRDQKGTKIRV